MEANELSTNLVFKVPFTCQDAVDLQDIASVLNVLVRNTIYDQQAVWVRLLIESFGTGGIALEEEIGHEGFFDRAELQLMELVTGWEDEIAQHEGRNNS
jgi:hypothetical protein